MPCRGRLLLVRWRWQYDSIVMNNTYIIKIMVFLQTRNERHLFLRDVENVR